MKAYAGSTSRWIRPVSGSPVISKVSPTNESFAANKIKKRRGRGGEGRSIALRRRGQFDSLRTRGPAAAGKGEIRRLVGQQRVRHTFGAHSESYFIEFTFDCRSTVRPFSSPHRPVKPTTPFRSPPCPATDGPGASSSGFGYPVPTPTSRTPAAERRLSPRPERLFGPYQRAAAAVCAVFESRRWRWSYRSPAENNDRLPVSKKTRGRGSLSSR